LQEWLAEADLVWFFSDALDTLDPAAFDPPIVAKFALKRRF
jgi:hypothetical protein